MGGSKGPGLREPERAAGRPERTGWDPVTGEVTVRVVWHSTRLHGDPAAFRVRRAGSPMV
ncbi:hypothetical protein GCM10010517_27370 [Streptosporangium fragile]|uniref:Uncharacterized protein n=1 Tax=Streptosporangium fragile TaxID=46186 RepID=A0ABP6IC19_9ACTN